MCFSETFADVIPSWHCVNKHLNAPTHPLMISSSLVDEHLWSDVLVSDDHVLFSATLEFSFFKFIPSMLPASFISSGAFFLLMNSPG